MHITLSNNEVTSVKFGRIKYVSYWTYSHLNFFAGVQATTIGQWESCVVRAANTGLML